MKHTIYVVEDDAALQEVYVYSLENEFDCFCFDDGISLFAALAKSAPDLIVLDIMLPGEDGFSILSRLKENPATSSIPVIMVSAKGEEISKVKGLNMGAEDYIAKPFGILELIARINANLRKTIQKAPETTAYKDILIDHVRHRTTINGRQTQLSLKEYNLLFLFCENPEKALSREAIFDIVWENGFVGESRTLDIHVKELRKKLVEAESAATIQTIRGVGYMLT